LERLYWQGSAARQLPCISESERTMTLKVGIVGCGDIFPTHVKGWSAVANYEVHSVFDADPGALRKAAGHPGVRGTSSSLAELIDCCDVIDICTPPDSHAEIALAAIQKRRDLFIEKPVVPTSREWEHLVQKAREAGTKICAMFNQKFLPQARLARRWIDEGRIGRVIRVRTEQYDNPGKDWMLANPNHWSHRLPGGRWFETLPHDIYLIRFFAGPVEVTSVSALTAAATGPNNPSEIVVSLKGSGCLAEVHYSSSCERRQRNIVVTGTRGTIEITNGLVATLSTLNGSRLKNEVGMPFVEAVETLSQLIPDRLRWWSNRLKRVPPHSRLIAETGRYFEGAGPAPTTLEEIGNVVDCCEVAGRKIKIQMAATTIASPPAPGAPVAPGDRAPSEVPRPVP
jgi:predicted dehydrogenase